MKPMIISGVCKGMKLEIPEGNTTRPTSSRAREALLSSLQTRISDAKILDLFAGSGALSFECLSRGAKEVTLVENHRPAIRAIDNNWQELRGRFVKQNLETPSYTLIPLPVEKLESRLISLRVAQESFDILFADPPYEKLEDVLGFVLDLTEKYLAREGVLVLEHSSDQKLNWQDIFKKHSVHNFRVLQEKRYGLVSFVFFDKISI